MNAANRPYASVIRLLILSSCMSVMDLSLALEAAAQDPHVTGPAELFVVRQVVAGRSANLSREFPTKAERRLRASFFERLLTGELENVKVGRGGIVIVGAVFDEPIDLNDAEIPYRTTLVSCEFSKPVDAARSRFRLGFAIADSTFSNKEEALTLTGAKIGGDALFSGDRFDGPVSFDFSEIVGYFTAKGSRFTNASRDSSFTAMKVQSYVQFGQAVFAGPVSFNSSMFNGSFNANEAKFGGSADFSLLKVAGAVLLSGGAFAGPVSFQYLEANALELDNAKFEGTVQSHDLKVKWHVTFDEALFGDEVNCDGLQAGGLVSFQDTTFRKSLSIEDAQLVDLTLEGDARPMALADLRLSRTAIQRKLAVRNVDVKKLFAPNLRISGAATVAKVAVHDETDLRNSQFTVLDLDMTMPANREKVRLEGMTYQNLTWGNLKNGDGRRQLLALIDGAAYSRETYGRLEAFFKSQGYSELADETFLAMKRRERTDLRFVDRLGSFTLDVLVRYGRRPERILVVVLAFVVLGAVVFRRRRDVEPRNPDDGAQSYNAVWYSLDLFLPALNLQAASMWAPNRQSSFRRNYARLHRMAGWILVPLGVAAVAGLLR